MKSPVGDFFPVNIRRGATFQGGALIMEHRLGVVHSYSMVGMNQVHAMMKSGLDRPIKALKHARTAMTKSPRRSPAFCAKLFGLMISKH